MLSPTPEKEMALSWAMPMEKTVETESPPTEPRFLEKANTGLERNLVSS